MFPLPVLPLQIKLALASIVAVVIGALSWGVHHYHSLYITSLSETAVQVQIKKEALANLKTCSDNTLALAEQAKLREVKVAADQIIADAAAKKHSVAAVDILTKYIDVPTSSCPLGNDVINQYLKDIEDKP